MRQRRSCRNDFEPGKVFGGKCATPKRLSVDIGHGDSTKEAVGSKIPGTLVPCRTFRGHHGSPVVGDIQTFLFWQPVVS